MRIHLRSIIRVFSPGKKPAVNSGMQSFDPAIHNFRRSSVFRDVHYDHTDRAKREADPSKYLDPLAYQSLAQIDEPDLSEGN